MPDPALVQQASNGQFGGLNAGLTVVVTLGSGTTAGNALYALASWGSPFTTWVNGTDSFTFPAGWVKVGGIGAGSGAYIELWYHENITGGITTVSITSTKPGGVNNAETQYWVGEFSNVAASSSLDQSGTATGSSSTPSVSTSSADTQVKNLVLAGFVWQTGSRTTLTADTGYTAITVLDSNNVQQSQLEGEYGVGGATLAVRTAAPTLGASEGWKAIIATFKGTSVAPSAALALTMGDVTMGAAGTELFTAPLSLTMGDVTMGAAAGFTAASASLQMGDFLLGASGTQIVFTSLALTMDAFLMGAQETFSTAALAITLTDTRLGAQAAYSAAALALLTPSVIMGSAAQLHLGPPTVTSVTPFMGGQLQAVVITGTNFLTATDVLFGPYHYFGYPFTSLLTIVSNTEIHVFAPDPFYLSTVDLDNLLVDVQVVNNDGTSPPDLNHDAYTIVAPPVITSVNPNVVFIQDGTATLTLRGKNFQTASLLQVGGQDVSFTIDWSEDGLTATCGINLTTLGLDPGAGAYPIVLWNASGPSAVHNPLLFVLGGQTYTVGPLDWALSGRYGPVIIHYRFERRDRFFTFIEDMTPAVQRAGGCAIHLDNDQVVARTADFLLRGDLIPAGFTGSVPSGEGIAVWADVLVEGSFVAFPLGLFHLDTPTINQSTLGYEEWQAKGSDMTIVPANRTTTSTVTIPAGTNYATYIRNLCTSLGLNLANWSTSFVTPAVFSWPPKTPYIQIINDLLFGINYYPLFADAEGKMTALPRVVPSKNRPAVRYSSIDEPRMLDSSTPMQKVSPQTTFQNYVTVAIDDPARDAYNAQFTNADPSSPISTVASGREEVLAISGSGSPSGKCLLDGPTANAVAIYELQEEATRAIERTIYTLPDPRRTNREYYQLAVEHYELETLWRDEKWDLVCETGGQMTHVLGTAAPVAVSSGAPSLTRIVQRIGTIGIGNTSPLASNDCQIDVQTTTALENIIVVAVLADQQPVGVVDTGGNIYLPLASDVISAAHFGLAGIHPVTGAGLFKLYLYAAPVVTPLHGQGADAITVTLATGATSTYWAAAAAWEIAGASTSVDGTASAAVATDPAGANTLSAVDSGKTVQTQQAADFILGMVGAVIATSNPTDTRAFAVTPLQGWDPAQAVAIALPPFGGITPFLFLQLQIAQGAGQYQLTGTFTQPVEAFAAAVVPITGSTV